MDEVEARGTPLQKQQWPISPKKALTQRLQYVALDAFKDKELTDHQEKQKRDDPRIQHDFSAAADGASAWRQTLCCLCVEWAVLGIF